ncbi:MAG: hypothetical protein ABSD75_31985 [Terriglobales bacterium]|jgi:hypothetical protein
MKTLTDRQDAVRFWGLGALSVLLSAGAAFSYLHSMGYGIAAGDLIGVRGREGDVAYVQRWATVWLMTAVCCLGVSSLAGALATSIYEDAARVSRLIARLVVASVVSFVLAVLIGIVSFSIITASHHSVVR